MEVGAYNCKHIFMDIVGYSNNRSVEAQIDIITKLNDVVKKVLAEFKVSPSKRLLLPTGDGICLTFINQTQYDFSINVAVRILESIKQINEQTDDKMRQFLVRIGINENIDNIIIDINNKKNVAGSGINYAQRIMSLADGNMIMIGSSVYEQLKRREKFIDKFKGWKSNIKHGEVLTVYQYIDDSIPVLNTLTPIAFNSSRNEKKQVHLTDHLAMYLVIIYKGGGLFGPLIKKATDSEYLVIVLYYLSFFEKFFFSNSKNIVKDYTSAFLESITDEGRCILITKAITEIKEILKHPLFTADLTKHYYNNLIQDNNAEELFVDPENPIQLSDKGKSFVEEHCTEQLEFIQEIK